MKIPVVMSWSGGKDNATALHQLLRSDSYQVVSLLTSVSEELRRISHHGVREALLEEQAKAIRIRLRKVYLPSGNSGGCTNDVYEAIMERMMTAYRARGVRTVAFGDLFLQDLCARAHRNLTHKARAAVTPNGGDEDVAWSKNRAGGLVQTNRGRGSRS